MSGANSIANPFNVDAATVSQEDLSRLPPHGGPAVLEFCGSAHSGKDWDERGVCVLKARKGFGKSHLLAVRSLHHRSSQAASRTIFYPQSGGKSPILFDALSSLNVVVPRWLQGRESVAAWVQVWQLAILGLLVWITDSRSPDMRGYTDWFGSLERLYGKTPKGESARSRQPVMLTWFMVRILEQLPADDYQNGTDRLKQGLNHASIDWAVAITSGLTSRDKTRIAMYLDAPDELVELDSPNLWRNVQQGLLLAIWKLSKNSTWSRNLQIYATVRSEAFGAGQDHSDVALAMGLVMPLRYRRNDLEGMLNDRIRQAEPSKLALPLADCEKPVHALCGFDQVVHQDRTAQGGMRYTEDVFDSILRHTRLVPREVIGIGGAIYNMAGAQSFETTKKAVNSQASLNIAYAITHSFLGWSDQHYRFAALLRKEVIDRKTMADIAEQFGEDGPKLIKFFVQHGLLGTAEPLPQRHRHYYLQRFAFDEVHGHAESSSINKDFFFVHPSFKEWILSLPEQLTASFERLKVGVIGDIKTYEAQPPIFRLGLANGKVTLHLRSGIAMIAADHSYASEPLQFLFVLLWATMEKKGGRIALTDLKDLWLRLQKSECLGSALRMYLPDQHDALVAKFQRLYKKINRDREIKELHSVLVANAGMLAEAEQTRPLSSLDRRAFIRLTNRSEIGAQAEAWFPTLPVGELDWDDELHDLIDRKLVQ